MRGGSTEPCRRPSRCISPASNAGPAETAVTVYRSIYRRWIATVVGKGAVNALYEQDVTGVVNHLSDAVPNAASTAKYILGGLSDGAADQEL